jgi:hypothetical protein
MLIGFKNYNFDKSFDWDYGETPNLYEPDIILIDLTTLSIDILERNEKKYRQLIEIIFNKFLNGGKIVFITTTKLETKSKTYLNANFSNYFLSPIEFDITMVNKGRKIHLR